MIILKNTLLTFLMKFEKLIYEGGGGGGVK